MPLKFCLFLQTRQRILQTLWLFRELPAVVNRRSPTTDQQSTENHFNKERIMTVTLVRFWEKQAILTVANNLHNKAFHVQASTSKTESRSVYNHFHHKAWNIRTIEIISQELIFMPLTLANNLTRFFTSCSSFFLRKGLLFTEGLAWPMENAFSLPWDSSYAMDRMVCHHSIRTYAHIPPQNSASTSLRSAPKVILFAFLSSSLAYYCGTW